VSERRRGCEKRFRLEIPDTDGRSNPSSQYNSESSGLTKGGDALVIEVVVKFVVEAFDVFEWRNDLLQIVVLRYCSGIWGFARERSAHLLLAENRIVDLGHAPSS
jgi:hypothetical protein